MPDLITSETLSQLTHSRRWGAEPEESPGIWRDILHAMHGLEPWKVSFMLYVYADDEKSRHPFFSGLFMEAMERPEIQLWIRQRREQPGYHRAVETLCLLAMVEWKHWNVQILQADRARHMGVSRSTWQRKYRLVYSNIYSIPAAWEKEVIEIINQRLR